MKLIVDGILDKFHNHILHDDNFLIMHYNHDI